MKSHASMNRIYRLVWNATLGVMVAVAENAKGRGKSSTSRGLVAGAVALTGGLFLAPFAQAGPAGGQVSAGAGSIAQAGTNTTITQTSQNLSLNWKSFNVAPQETVNFVQPSVSAIAVNRIFDTNGSQILGHLNANGQVYLINPNGILFGAGAQINVGGLVASTLDLHDASLSGNARTFSANGASGTGSIVNQGTINAANGGFVALLGNTVSNQGTITAPLGTVALGAGSAATLNFNGNSLVKMQIDQGVLNSLADNGGLIRADGGQVIMTAGAKEALLASVVNNTGKIEARTVQEHNGSIILLGGMTAGTVNVGGTLDASAPNGGNGGFIETSAAHVKIADAAKITTAAPAGNTGTWLIDPVDFTIAATGGDITGAALGTLLASNSITVQTATSPTATATNLIGSTGTNGDIYVNDAVSWSANNTLTLDAYRNININQSIGATTGKLALLYGQGAVAANNAATYKVNAAVNLSAGANFSTTLGSGGAVKNYTVITSLGAVGSITATDLQGMGSGLTTNYALGSNIDATATSGWNTNAGFVPIGNSTANFTGSFDGLGHTISSLTINRSATDNVGLFGVTGVGSVIQNVGLVNASVTGRQAIGGLVGDNSGTISSSYATGSVTGTSNYVGGLAGGNSGTISSSYATGSVTGSVNGITVGGLVGDNGGTISNSYATGNVSGNNYVGGLVGDNYSGTIRNSYATGNVSGSDYVGGLAGNNYGRTISNSYATGRVTGRVNGITAGGLVGSNVGTINTSYWNTTNNISGRVGIGGGTKVGATGLTSTQMMQMASFSSWNTATPNSIANTGGTGAVWRIYEGNTTPLLTSFMTGLTLSDASVAYNGVEQLGTTTALNGVSGIAAKGTNAGTYLNSYYSTQQGYDISGGNLTINAATLSAISMTGTRAYDGTANVAAGIFTLSGLVNGENLNLTGVGTVADKNVGNNKTVTLGSLALGDGSNGLASNYTFTGGTQTASITQAALALSTGNVTKIYDAGLTAAGTVAVSAGTLFAGDTLSGGSFTFTDKNVGSANKTVVVSGVTVSDGVNNANYNVSYANNTTSTITAANLSVTGIIATNKVYDSTTTASLGGSAAVAALGTDSVTLGGSASGVFADKNVGSAKSVTVSGNTLGGTDAGNYNLVQQAGLTAEITKANLSVSGLTASAKVYNANTVATLGGTAAVSALTGDSVTLGGSASGVFADKNVGSAKSVTVSGNTLGGTDAGNYTLVQQVGLTADINKANLSVTGITASAKVYDTTLTATLGGTAVIAALGSDVITLGGTASGVFGDKNAATGKAVSVTGNTITGTDAGNYNLQQQTGLSAGISKANLAVTGITAGHKVYDTTSVATLGGTAAVAVLRGDAVNVTGSGSGTFANSNVGSGKAVTVSGFTLSGTDAGNYAVMQPTGITADITAPEQVRNVITQLVSTVLAPTMGVQPGALSLSPSITVAQNSSPVTPSSNSGSVAAGETSPSKADKGPMVNVTMNIGTMGSTLQIISGGMKLPGNMVNVNE